MEYKKTGETKARSVYGSNVASPMGNGSSIAPEGQPAIMPGNQPMGMAGNQPWMMPGCYPAMMWGNQSSGMPRNAYTQRSYNPSMMAPPYPVYPSNMVMPYYYGETVQGMETLNDSNFTEDDLDRELEQIMDMYPSRAKEIQKKVVEVCNSIDYDGSILYDEYPDKFVLSRYCDKIYEDIDKAQVEMASEKGEAQQVSSTERRNGGGRQPCRNCRPNDGGRDLIDVLFFNEIFRRRCRKGKCRRW